VWSIATPLMAAPDEPAQMAQAAALVRGQFDRPFHPVGQNELATVTVPYWVWNAGVLANCIARKPTVPASCQQSVSTSSRPTPALTSFTNYPPLYFALAGLPSLLVGGAHGVHAMRMMSALVNAALIALGLFLLARYHPRRFTLVGALIALSPMVLFITAVINESGLEVAAGFAAWCAGLALIERDPIPRALVTWGCVAFALLILARPLSPAYALILAAALGLRAGWNRSAQILRDPRTRPVWLTVAASVVIAGAFFIADGSPKLLGTAPQTKLGLVAALKVSLRLTWTRLRETIGNFGWLDTPAPHATVLIWVSAAVALVVVAVVVDRGCRYALIFLSVAILALPLVLESPTYNSIGTYWQGRYWLPLIVGIPLLASTASIRWHRIDKALRKRRWVLPISVLAIGAVLIGAQVDAFATMLRRYEVGLGPGPHLRPRWSPPGGSALLTALLVTGEALLVGLAAWQVTARGPHGTPAPELDHEGAAPS
jgi:Predicted membrane protein (DUF2142)